MEGLQKKAFLTSVFNITMWLPVRVRDNIFIQRTSTKEVQTIERLFDLNGMIIRLQLFYDWELGNSDYSMFIFTFFV